MLWRFIKFLFRVAESESSPVAGDGRIRIGGGEASPPPPPPAPPPPPPPPPPVPPLVAAYEAARADGCAEVTPSGRPVWEEPGYARDACRTEHPFLGFKPGKPELRPDGRLATVGLSGLFQVNVVVLRTDGRLYRVTEVVQVAHTVWAVPLAGGDPVTFTDVQVAAVLVPVADRPYCLA